MNKRILGIALGTTLLPLSFSALACPDFIDNGETYRFFLADFKLVAEVIDHDDEGCWIKFKEGGSTKWLNVHAAQMVEPVKQSARD